MIAKTKYYSSIRNGKILFFLFVGVCIFLSDAVFVHASAEPVRQITIGLNLPAKAQPLELVRIPSGSFIMGSPANDPSRNADERPQHQVTLTHDFYMGKYEITNAQYRMFDSLHRSRSWDRISLNEDNQPVISISWNDAVVFCEWLNVQCGYYYPGMRFRLPTEAEWEYACRAGTATRRYWGDDLNNDQAGAYANTADLSAKGLFPKSSLFNTNDGYLAVAPVGMFKPNAFGLYDMLGNASEMCWDAYGSYPVDAQFDPKGPNSQISKVARGGAWSDGPNRVRSAARYSLSRDDSNYLNTGFRIVLETNGGSPESISLPTVTPVPVKTPLPAKTPTPTPTQTPTPIPAVSTPVDVTPLQTAVIDLPGLPIDAKKLEMVLIPAGTFMMGCATREAGRIPDESPQHQVTLTKNFYMGKYEITTAQFRLFKSRHKIGILNDISWDENDRAVVDVSWNEAMAYCEWLNTQFGKNYPGIRFRLPTEAEWEYACRAGTVTRRYWGEDLKNDQAGQYANVADLTLRPKQPNLTIFYINDGYAFTSPVGTYKPNAFGLYDMLGNARELCLDFYGQYKADAQVNPQGIGYGMNRIVRGGSYSDGPEYVRSAVRFRVMPDDSTYRTVGFRVVLENNGEYPGHISISTITPVPVKTPTPTQTPIPASATPIDVTPLQAAVIDLPGLPIDAKKLEMVLIPAGSFMMGSSGGDAVRYPDESPQHQVTLTKNFYMGKYEITTAQFRLFKSRHKIGILNDISWDENDRAVVDVSWNEAMEYCEWLNTQTGKNYPGMNFRLPTEAEWEYACRAGTTTRRYWGDDLMNDQVSLYANVAASDAVDGYKYTSPVGIYRPNAFGLYDMMGNAGELCLDFFGAYKLEAQVNPQGAGYGRDRVFRGGSWSDSPADNVRSAYRSHIWPENGKSRTIGFRVVLEWTGDCPQPIYTPKETPAPIETSTPTPTQTPAPIPASATPVDVTP